jgi:hypothetical protein
MIEIVAGSVDEQIITILQKRYPVTVEDLVSQIPISRERIVRVLHQFEVQGIVSLEPLPDKTFIRLLRQDFKFIRKKQQRKFIKHRRRKPPYKPPSDHDDVMYG